MNRFGWILSISLGLLAANGGSARAEPGCYLRTLAAEDGSPSGMDDCQLAQRLERADLRSHLQTCARAAARGDTRVYGTIQFRLDLHPGGGLSNLQLPRSVFDRTSLPACIKRVLRRRLAGPKTGKPAALMGRFSLERDAEERFGFSLSGQLIPKKKPLPPLSGTFRREPDGLVTRCGLADGQLVLRLDPQGGFARRSWSDEASLPEAVTACVEPADDASQHGGRSRRRSSRKRQITHCLVDLLADPAWSIRAAAAEELARGWRWRGRRAIRRTVDEILRGKDCLEKARQEEKAQRRGGADREPAGAGRDPCPIRVPPAAEAGHALVRMVRAHLRLRRRPGEGVLAALATHPDPQVRLRLIDTILARWNSGLPEGLDRLIDDADPLVRGRAQQIGCLRGDYASLNAFRRDLGSSDPRVRVQAVLSARACVQRSPKAVAAAVAAEDHPTLALLTLLSAPTPRGTLLLERAGPGLFDPCPLVRYLSGKLLFRLREVPGDLISTALAREVDPILRQQLQQLSAQGSSPAPVQRSEQIWFQTAPAAGRAGP